MKEPQCSHATAGNLSNGCGCFGGARSRIRRRAHRPGPGCATRRQARCSVRAGASAAFNRGRRSAHGARHGDGVASTDFCHLTVAAAAGACRRPPLRLSPVVAVLCPRPPVAFRVAEGSVYRTRERGREGATNWSWPLSTHGGGAHPGRTRAACGVALARLPLSLSPTPHAPAATPMGAGRCPTQ